MKEKDLYVDFKPQQLVYYVEKDDNSYGPIISGSQLSANYLDDFWEKKKSLELSLRNQLINGEISPVFYYMTLQEIGIRDLASRAGMSGRKLQKVFTLKYFRKISLEKLKIFADIFNVPVSEMLNSFQIKGEDRDKVEFIQTETKNDLYNITRINLK